MNDRLKIVQSLLLETLEIESADERAAFLSEACGMDTDLRAQVEALIAAQDAAGQFLPDRPSPNAAQAAWAGVASAAASPNGQLQATVTEKAGDWISHYRLLEKLGEGGCGLVYMAEQEKPVRRKVALKVIKLGMDTKSVVARFEAERQALALMDHPNIARVLDAGTTQSGRPFFVMELVRGIRVTKYCDQEQLSVRQRLKLFIQVCEAVQHAHQKGIIHRDLKPSNILVTVNDGVPVPKVIDFGIAKATSGRLTDNTLFTAFEQFLGTPAYMSPEQAAMTSLDIDTRSDIYSLGVLLYELLTGKTPFDTQALLASGIDELRRTICDREPLRPSTRLTMELEATNAQRAGRSIDEKSSVLNSGQGQALERVKFIRGDLDWIVMKCLEKDRARRYETANGLARDIERHLTNEPVVARPPSAIYRWQKVIQRNRLSFAAGTAVVLALVLGAVVSAWQAVRVEHERQQVQNKVVRQYVARGTELVNSGDLFGSLLWYAEALRLDQGDPRREEPHRIRIASVLRQCPKLVNVFSHGKMLYHAEFSPDGSKVLTASDDGTARLWDTLVDQPLFTFHHTGEVYDGRFDKDGLLIVTCGQDKTARVWSSQTGELVKSLQHPAKVLHARFSPDGKAVATACEDKTARLWNIATGAPLQGPFQHEAIVPQIAFSPDGRLLMTRTIRDTLCIWDVATGRRLFQHTDTENWGNDLDVRFRPDSRRFLSCEDTKVHVWDSETFNELASFPVSEVQDLAFGPDGNTIVAGGLDSTACVLDATAGQPRFSPPIQHNGFITSARFAPDGRSFVTGGNDAVAKVWSTSSGQLLVPPLKTIIHERYVTFAPDGRRLLLKSCDQAARVWDLATTDLLGPRRPARLNEHRVVSPDGRYVLLQGESNAVWLMDMHSGKKIISLPHSNEVEYASFNGDGRSVITAAAEQNWISDMVNEISLWEVPSGRRVNHIRMEQQFTVLYAAFSQDNSRLLTCGFDFCARLWNARTGKPLSGLMRHGQPVFWGAFSPDGRRVVTLSRDKTARVWDASGQPRTPPLRHKSKLVQASWSQNGKWLYTLTEDDYIQVWDLATGEALTPPRKVRDPGDDHITNSAVHVTGDETLPVENHSVEDLVRLSQMLAVGRIDQTGSLVPLELEELRRDWELLRDRFPDQFHTKNAEAAAWHRLQAKECDSEGNLGGVMFHIEQALKLTPFDSILVSNRNVVATAIAGKENISRRAASDPTTIPRRDPGAGPEQIDLSDYYNLSLRDSLSQKPDGNNLADLPSGLQTLAGVCFDVRGLIHLDGQSTRREGQVYPKRISNIQIGRNCQYLHFLQATSWDASNEDQIGKYVLHYADGEQRELPIMFGKDTNNWWWWSEGLPSAPESGGASVAWVGPNSAAARNGFGVVLFKSTRQNPRPGVKLISMDFVSTMSTASPFLVALTVE